jgi:hypothetical protein
VIHSSSVLPDAREDAALLDAQRHSPSHRRNRFSLLRAALTGLAMSVALSGCGVFCGGGGGSGGGFAAGCSTGVRF